MMGLFSIAGLIILVLVVLHFGKIVSLLTRLMFFFLLTTLILILVFGVSYEEFLGIIRAFIFLTF